MQMSRLARRKTSIACTVVSILGAEQVLPFACGRWHAGRLSLRSFKQFFWWWLIHKRSVQYNTFLLLSLPQCLLFDAIFCSQKGEDIFVGKCRMAEAERAAKKMSFFVIEFCHGAKWFGWFRLVCRACRCQRDTRKMEEASHWARNRNCFLTLSPVFENVLWSVLKLLFFFCHAHVHLGGFPLIQSLDSYHILSYQSYPVMSWSFLQLDSYGSLSIHRSFAVHQGTALSGDLLEARVKSPAVGIFERFLQILVMWSSWYINSSFSAKSAMRRAETCEGEATSHRGSKIEPQVGKNNTSTIFKYSICKSFGQDVSQSFFLKFRGLFVYFCGF